MNIERFHPDHARAVAELWNSLRARPESCLFNAREITPAELALNRWRPSFVALADAEVAGFLLARISAAGRLSIVAIAAREPGTPRNRTTCRTLVAALLLWARNNGHDTLHFALHPAATDAARWVGELPFHYLKTDGRGQRHGHASVPLVLERLAGEAAALRHEVVAAQPASVVPTASATRSHPGAGFHSAEQFAQAERRAAICRACDSVKRSEDGRPRVTALTVACGLCGCAGLSLMSGRCPADKWAEKS